MENYGSEIGQKMRSAVKAKLLELGTGGSSAYIDDELPDYVMIMVANKRSKQQMSADLNLFLGSQTELFVTWLHEVLQKLQEVTLPAASTSNKKRKGHHGTSEAAASKKDKKNAKKDKKGLKRFNDEAESPETERPTTTTDSVATPTPVLAINSITDVFAEDLLEKAKKTLDVTSSMKDEIKKKKRKASIDENAEQDANDTHGGTNDFDIPTISEITSTTGGNNGGSNAKEALNNIATSSSIINATSGNREKDLAELAEIQKKIYAAKKHLRKIGELDECDGDESEDGDFLNLNEQESVDDDIAMTEHNTTEKATEIDLPKKAKSPIVFNRHTETPETPDEIPVVKLYKSASPLSLPLPQPPRERERRDGDREHERERANIREREREHQRERESIRRPTTTTSEEYGERRESIRRPTTTTSEDYGERRESIRRPTTIISEDYTERRSVHERLGIKTNALAADSRRLPRQQKELYVPAHRRQELNNEKDRDRDRERNREREREQERNRSRQRGEQQTGNHSRDRAVSRDNDRRERYRDTSRNIRRSSPENPLSRAHETLSDDFESSSRPKQRIVSHVIVAASKPIESSDSELIDEKPVNSIIKVKPRPPVSPSRQACKNLLLRAVADAQRSTILVKSPRKRKSEPEISSSKRSNAIGIGEHRGLKLYSKSYRERERFNRSHEPSVELFRRTTRNLVVKVKNGSNDKQQHQQHQHQHCVLPEVVDLDAEMEVVESDEYVPEMIIENDDSQLEYNVYVPQVIDPNNENSNDEIHEVETDLKLIEQSQLNTQFVVTLHGEKTLDKYKKRSSTSRRRSPSPLPQVSSSSSGVAHNTTEPPSSTTGNSSNNSSSIGRRSKTDARTKILDRLKRRTPSNSPSSSNTPPPPPITTRNIRRDEALRQSKIDKKIVIRPDTDEDEEMSPNKINSSSPNKINSSSPNKINSSSPNKINSSSLNKINSSSTYKRQTGNSSASNKRHIDQANVNGHNKDIEDLKGQKSKKLNIMRNNDERSTTPPMPPKKQTTTTATTTTQATRSSGASSSSGGGGSSVCEKRMNSSSSINEIGDKTPAKVKHKPITFTLKNEERERPQISPKRERYDESIEHEREREKERERERGRCSSTDEKRKIPTRTAEDKKYDNIPSLSSVAVDSTVLKVVKPKERCKYHPNCTKQFCDFYHPTATCKSFPNCKFADKCLYAHPKCKYDLSCMSIDCNFAHSGPRDLSHAQLTAPPLSSHVIPVQNYKSISASAANTGGTTGTTMCKYYPNCTKVGCTFYHPKLCRYGKNCINKLECIYYHPEMQSSNKFKWVATLG